MVVGAGVNIFPAVYFIFVAVYNDPFYPFFSANNPSLFLVLNLALYPYLMMRPC